MHTHIRGLQMLVFQKILRTYLMDITCCQFSYINRLQMKLWDLKIVVNKCVYMSLLFTYVHTKSTKESKRITETHGEPSEISKMELFAKIVHGFHLLTIFAKAPSQMFDWILNRPLSQFTLTTFTTNIALLYPLKISENCRLPDVFRGYRSGALVENGLT